MMIPSLSKNIDNDWVDINADSDSESEEIIVVGSLEDHFLRSLKSKRVSNRFKTLSIEPILKNKLNNKINNNNVNNNINNNLNNNLNNNFRSPSSSLSNVKNIQAKNINNNMKKSTPLLPPSVTHFL